MNNDTAYRVSIPPEENFPSNDPSFGSLEFFNPFKANVTFLYPLTTLENL